MTKKPAPTETVASRIKALLPDPILRIELDDYASTHLRQAEQTLSLENFPNSGAVTPQEFADRLRKYEQAVSEVQIILMLLAYWGEPRHQALVDKIFARIAEVEKGLGGTVVWLRLRWYPALVLQYSTGIAALASRNYDALRTILTSPLETGERSIPNDTVVQISMAMGEILDAFKHVSGNPNHYVPLSEYMFQVLRKPVESVLDVGQRFETLFDRYEILSALACGDALKVHGRSPLSLFGRFAWKQQRGNAPFNALAEEAKREGEQWMPLKAGLFGGSLMRFEEIASAMSERFGRLGWM